MDDNPFIAMPKFPLVDATPPATEIWLAAGIPWNNTYQHVRLFDNQNALVNYIKSKTPNGFSFRDCAPVNEGKAVVNLPLNELIANECNYIMFINLPYATDYQFGFIKHVNPLSVNSCIVEFEIDVWQKNIYDATIKPSFIERQIVKKASDTIGAYLYPDNLECGEYVVAASDKNVEYQAPTRDERGAYAIVFASTFNDEGDQSTSGTYQQDVYSAIQYNVFDTPAAANYFLEQVVNLGYIDGIIDCFMMPADFAVEDDLQYKTIEIPKKYDNINGYIPKNNKLFTYPYNFLYANNNNGVDIEYRYEDFNTAANPNVCIMTYTISLATNPTLYCYPQDYRGMSQDYIDALSFNNYPKCAINVDAFKAWLAQTGSSRLINGLTQVGVSEGIATGLATVVNYVSNATTASNTLSGVIGGIAQVTSHYVQPPQAKNVNANTILHSIGNDRIDFFRMQIKREYAEIIDNFWSMFGYPIMRVKPVTLKNRSSWDYIKTQNVVITANTNDEQLKELCKIFDNGVTIWHTNDIGNYSLQNN